MRAAVGVGVADAGESAQSPPDEPIANRYRTFRQELFDAGLLVATGVDGLYLRSGVFERIVQGIDAAVTRAGADHRAGALHFPLLVRDDLLAQTDYLRSFPDLAGTVQSFYGDDQEHAALLQAADDGRCWQEHFAETGLALCSAACHPLYPSQSGILPAGGRRVEVFGQCFRHEPSLDPARMQVFRQHEFVYLGDAEGARDHRDLWVERALALHRRLGLEVEAVVANDPFFGRAGRLLASSQRQETLKIEVVSPICSSESPTAITSANCHLDHFGMAFGIYDHEGGVAHTACVGFGVERITLALLHTHGLETNRWPSAVRNELGL